MKIACGQVISLASLFLELCYHELDQLHTLIEQVASSAPLKSFLCVSFLQIFLWERIKGLKITSYPSGTVKNHFVIYSLSYLPEKLLLACPKIPAKKQDFLELLDDMNSFVFGPYMSIPEGFTFMMFFYRCCLWWWSNCDVNSSIWESGFPFVNWKIVDCVGLFHSFPGEDSEEMCAVYSLFWMRWQLGFD